MPSKAKLVTRTDTTSTVTTDSIPKGDTLTYSELDSNLINLRDATFGVASDDSTVIDVGMGNTIKIAGSGLVTTAVSGQTLTITGSSGSITIVGDDSTGTAVTVGETFKIAGGNNITTAVSGDTLTITGSKTIDVNEINSGDSSAIQINDGVNVSGTLNAKTIVTNDLISQDSSAINVLDGMNVSGTLSADVLDVNELSSNDSTAIQINDAVNISGAATINNTLAVTSTSRFTGDATFLGSIKGDANSPVTIAPDGTGDVHLNTDSVRIGDNNSDATIATRGTGDLILTTHEGSGTEGVIRIYDGANGNITVTPNGTGDVHLGTDNLRIGDQNVDATLATYGTGDLILTTNEGGVNEAVIRLYDNADGNISITPNGTGDVQLVADTVQIGDSNEDATITTNGTGDIILNTNSGTNSGTIKIEHSTAGKISIIPNTTGRVDLGHETETTTNFPSAVGSLGAFEVTDARIRGVGRFYSNLTYAPYTAVTDQVLPSQSYAMIKTNGGSFDSANIRTVASNNQMVFDLNGGSATGTTTAIAATGVGPQLNTNYYMNTAGGTKTGLNVTTNRNFTTIVAGHGGALTIPQTIGVVSDLAIARNTGDTTTLSEAWAFRDLGITYSGTGVTGTNSIVTEYTAYETGNSSPSSTNTPWAFRVRASGQNWRSRIGAVDLPRRWPVAATHSSGGAYTVNWQTTGHGFHLITLTSNITSFTMSNFPTSALQVTEFDLVFIQDGTGGRTISFTPTGSEVFKFRNGTSSLSDSTAAPEVLHAKVFTRYDGTKTIFYWDIDNREYV